MEHRHAAVAPVCDDDAPVRIDVDVDRAAELPLAVAVRAERVHMDAARVEYDDPVVFRVGDDDPAVGGGGRGALGATKPAVLGPGVPELAGVRRRKGRRRGLDGRRLRVRRRQGAAAVPVPSAPRRGRGHGHGRVVVPRQGRGVPRRRGGVVRRAAAPVHPDPAHGQGGGVRHKEYEAAQDGYVPVPAGGAPPARPLCPMSRPARLPRGAHGGRRRSGLASPLRGAGPQGAAKSHACQHPAPPPPPRAPSATCLAL